MSSLMRCRSGVVGNSFAKQDVLRPFMISQ
jgi:hypothetical protein